MMDSDNPNRRRFLAAAGGAVLTASIAGCTDDEDPEPVDDTEPEDDPDEIPGADGPFFDNPPEYGDFFDGVHSDFADIYDEQMVDWTGEDAVTIWSADEDNSNVFYPFATAVSPGTTVTWEHKGSGHNAVLSEGAGDEAVDPDDYDDIGHEALGDPGDEFVDEFEDEGAYFFECTPHQPEMVAVVYVTDE